MDVLVAWVVDRYKDTQGPGSSLGTAINTGLVSLPISLNDGSSQFDSHLSIIHSSTNKHPVVKDMEVPVNSSEKETHDGQDLSVRASQLSGNVGTSELIGNVVDPALAAKTRLLNEVRVLGYLKVQGQFCN